MRVFGKHAGARAHPLYKGAYPLMANANMMERILILGCCGSGKTTLGRALAERLGLPLVPLDALYWRDGWQSVPEETFDALLTAELIKPRWILDGNYQRTMPLRLAHCDTVIYLDYPRIVCLYGVLRRVCTGYGKSRPDMGGNCPERLDLSFLWYVLRFNGRFRKRTYALLTAHPDVQTFVFKSRKACAAFVDSLPVRAEAEA